MPPFTAIENALWTQRGHWFHWAPVCLALGIGGYFALRFEPSARILAWLAVLAVLAALPWWRWRAAVTPILLGIALVAGGVLLAAGRTHNVSAPRLDYRYFGAIEGRVIHMDRSASDAVRLTLDQVRIPRLTAEETPNRVRISLHGDQPYLEPRILQRISVTGFLAPPSGPVEPGGFDFQRHTWFQGLGAVGYARRPAFEIAPPRTQADIRAVRFQISAAVQARLDGDLGGFAAAVTTGDRGGISTKAMENLRASNLAHLLAISGLHMGLLAGVVFAALRFALCLWPPWALRLPVKAVAAAGAMLAATGYLALSGGSIATERAFIMACVALFAVILDRRVISMRAVAWAAVIVLALRPESLLSPGFQMSFAATTALVFAFGALRDAGGMPGPKWLRGALAVVMSSAVAGAATAPFAAAHFNHFAAYGLLANLLAVPVMGLIVVPGAVVAACLAPLGLEGLGLEIMGLGLAWILGVAETVAGFDGARVPIFAPASGVLGIFALGAIFVMLWQGGMRWVGLLAMVASLHAWTLTERPQVLIADTGNLIGVMTEKGRALSRSKGQGFVARNWLENDGDPADQDTAARRLARVAQGPFQVDLGAGTLWQISGKRAAREFSGCNTGDVVVTNTWVPIEGGCRLISPKHLRSSGAIALYGAPDNPLWVSVRDRRGLRPWTIPSSLAQ